MYKLIFAACSIIINPKLALIDRQIAEVEQRLQKLEQLPWNPVVDAQESTLNLARIELLNRRKALDFPNHCQGEPWVRESCTNARSTNAIGRASQ
jgi:hypothetical protein